VRVDAVSGSLIGNGARQRTDVRAPADRTIRKTLVHDLPASVERTDVQIVNEDSTVSTVKFVVVFSQCCTFGGREV
jgi:hypothetical protein